MSITIELSPAVEAALLADATAQGRDAADVAAERLAALYLPEPPVIEEGSPEEDEAIEAALNGPFHPFDPQALQGKMRQKYGLA